MAALSIETCVGDPSETVAATIRAACDDARARAPASARAVWDARKTWITEEASAHERLLTSAFPCLNPIAAQIILAVLPLHSVVTLPAAVLKAAAPWIPARVLDALADACLAEGRLPAAPKPPRPGCLVYDPRTRYADGQTVLAVRK